MSTTTTLPRAMLKFSTVAYAMFRKFLMAIGLVVVALVGLHFARPGLVEDLKDFLPGSEATAMESASFPEAEAASFRLSPRLRGALEYVSRRYRVSTEALEPVFATAESVGGELNLDPLLIIAVIGVESSFNPFSQSVLGAQGLMQVMPRFHMDKLPEEADRSAFLDPIVNIQVGARVLQEYIRRNGGLEEGLQQFGGAAEDPERRYAGKVLAEKERLERAVQRLRPGTLRASLQVS